MYISRIVVRNFRNFEILDCVLQQGTTCIVGENNTGKTNLLHSIRLVIDANLSSQYRQLTEHDIHSGVDLTMPSQVLVSLDIEDYAAREIECALASSWEIEPDHARVMYRFRPKQAVREEIEQREREPSGLTLQDYAWELSGGGPGDPATLEWDEENGQQVRFSDLQAFQVVFLQALRDVEQDLRSVRNSPLGRLISTVNIPEADKEALVDMLKDANNAVTQTPFVSDMGSAIKDSFNATIGEAFNMEVRLGMADPSFASISRSLTLLLTDDSLMDFAPDRNGLGVNNVLYISMLLEYFERRIATARTAGQLLLIEEPEAHLHPQLQRVLYSTLSAKRFQTIVTTHSSHITSHAPLRSLMILTNTGEPASASAAVCETADFGRGDIADLERYLDATRSTLMYARRVMLVEGPAEVFLIPSLVKQVLRIDFDRKGISVVPIYGVHFKVYAKLFSEDSIPKRCAIVADGDLRPSDADDSETFQGNLSFLDSEYVKVFSCTTTFERALVIPGTLLFLEQAARDAGANELADDLRETHDLFARGDVPEEENSNVLGPLRESVLKLAKRIGKARFAQLASKHVGLATDLPPYIREAVRWLIES